MRTYPVIRFYSNRPIQQKLLLWFLVFSLLPLGISGYFAFSTASVALKNAVEDEITRRTVNNLDKIDRNLLERYNDVQVWSSLEISKVAATIGSGVGGASEFVNYLMRKYRFYSVMMLLDERGVCITVNTINHAGEPIPTEELFLGQSFRQASWFEEAFESEGTQVIITDWERVNLLEMLAQRLGQKPESAYSVLFSSAIRDYDGTRLGIWVNVLNWETIQEILSQIQTEIPEPAMASKSLLLLADNDTIIASAGRFSEDGTPLFGKRLSQDLGQAQLVEQLSGTDGVFPFVWNGKPATIVASREQGYEQYPGKGWRYVLISDNETTYAQVYALRVNILVIGGISLILVMGLAYVIGRRIATPLGLLSRTAGAIANGNLALHSAITRFADDSQTNSHNEIRQLVHSFRQMAENLQRLIVHIQHASTRVRESSMQLSTAFHQLAVVADQQSYAIVQTTSAVEEFATSSGEIAAGAKTVTESARNTEQEAKKGVHAAIETLTRIQEIKQVNDQNMLYVRSLQECSQEINEIVETITTIADHTELIAFNAALEAAGAREHGRRFGIVAGEIRRLATTVTTAVKNIQQNTTEIQHGIMTLVSAFEIETRTIEKGVQEMKVASNALEAILEKIEQTTTSMLRISAATEQQQTGSEYLVATLQKMSQETVQFQEISQQTLKITTELNRLAEELLQAVNVFHIRGEML